MGVVRDLLRDVEMPRFHNLHSNFTQTHLDDVAEAVRAALRRPGTLDRIEKGKTVCFTASSREIANSVLILRTMAEEFKRVGAEPILIPAMGSHGGAIAEGQKAILDHYGITEEAVGCRIHSSMRTEKVGVCAEGLDVHMDSFALSCDYIIPTGRIKAHTQFRGPFESGIMKMMAIGLGKQYGASICHKLGLAKMHIHIPSFGRVALANCNIPFCFGIVENAVHQTHTVSAIPNELVEKEEQELLILSKSLMPMIPFEKVDVLIVEQMGKEISGDGMDPNVVGRTIWNDVSKPFIQRIGVLALSEKTGGNFNGVALADATTKRCFDRFDFEETYPNNLTAAVVETSKIPLVMDTDKLCVQVCLKTIHEEGKYGPRVVWIKDTLHLGEFYISESLYKEAKDNSQVSVDDKLYKVVFDENETFNGFKCCN